jgi:hypothetical protein
MGQIEMKCISNIGKNISILAKATQVSDVAHGPLVNRSNNSMIFISHLLEFSGLFSAMDEDIQMKFNKSVTCADQS